MIKFSWRVVVLCSVVGMFVGSVQAQNPTLKLVPTNAASVKRCTGGPENALPCGTASDCERGPSGSVYPECQRVCTSGEMEGTPCTTRSECGSGSCEQKCFCNRWVEAPPAFVTTRIVGLNWSPNAQTLRAWQAAVNLESACNAIPPLGWDRPCDPADEVSCDAAPGTVDPDCPTAYPICGELEICQGPTHVPATYSFICQEGQACPPDYVFSGLNELRVVDTSTLVFRYASTLLAAVGVPYSQERYFGTLTLERKPVLEGGCGTVTIGLSSPPSSNFQDANSLDIGPLDLEGLTFVMPACQCTAIEQGIDDTDPVRCAIDSRQGSEPDGSDPAGWTTVDLNLNCQNTAGVDPEDFVMREVPGVAIGNPTTVEINTPQDGWVRLTFPPTNPGVWTCIKFLSDNAGEVCIGGLPGDADWTRFAEAADIPFLIDCITDEAAGCALSQCDMDRSGTCAASDLVRLVDLLLGSETYAGVPATIPACPN